jgi:hypothetical protein
MSVDVGPLLELVARLADELEAAYGPDVELVNGMVVVELLPVEGSSLALEDVGSLIEHRATGRSTAAAIGLVELAGDSLRVDYVRGDE